MPDPSPSPRTVARELLIAVAVGAVLWLPLWLATGPLAEILSPPTHHYLGRFEVERLPGDDRTLVEWLASRGAAEIAVERPSPAVVVVKFRARERFDLEPAWAELGYGELGGRSSGWLTTRPLRLGWGFYLFLLARLSAVGLLLAAVRWWRARGLRWADLVRSRRPVGDACLGVGAGAGAFALQAAWAQLPRLWSGTPLSPSGMWAIVGVLPPWEGWLILALVALAVPLCEEAWFRGRLLEAPGRRAAAASVALFALLQASPLYLPVHVGLGIALVVLARRRGSLLAPIVAHAAFGGLCVGLGLAARGGLLSALGELLPMFPSQR